jgi:predicted transglutaminase-like cysteine proteinase
MGTNSPPAMVDGNLTAPPAGWLDFCKRNADDPYCRPIALTPDRWNQLSSVHRAVYSLGARADSSLFQRSDYWVSAGNQGGDCEDHALAARARLLELGWPPRSLRLAMAWTENGDYHAVLTIDAEQKGQLATYVLDSRFKDVRRWDELSARGYRWDRRQAPGLPFWVTVDQPQRVALAARS